MSANTDSIVEVKPVEPDGDLFLALITLLVRGIDDKTISVPEAHRGTMQGVRFMLVQITESVKGTQGKLPDLMLMPCVDGQRLVALMGQYEAAIKAIPGHHSGLAALTERLVDEAVSRVQVLATRMYNDKSEALKRAQEGVGRRENGVLERERRVTAEENRIQTLNQSVARREEAAATAQQRADTAAKAFEETKRTAEAQLREAKTKEEFVVAERERLLAGQAQLAADRRQLEDDAAKIAKQWEELRGLQAKTAEQIVAAFLRLKAATATANV